MEPATARVALKLQLDDVDAILSALPKFTTDVGINGKRAAFRLFREELVKKWNEVHGRVFAYSLIKEENANHAAFKKLLSDEQQAERDHDMACRLAGMPIPQRPAASNKRAADGDKTGKEAEAVNGSTLSSKSLRFDLSATQTATAKPESAPIKKRPAEDDLILTPTATNFKRARVENAVDEGEKPALLGVWPTTQQARPTTTLFQPVTPQAHRTTARPQPSTQKKRAVYKDPAVLRENEDGRTKRVKLTEDDTEVLVEDEDGKIKSVKLSDLASLLGLDGMATTTAAPGERLGGTPEANNTACLSSLATAQDSDNGKGKQKIGALRYGTCASCLDMHPTHNLLQLPCRDDGDTEAHAYCRDCLPRLFESSITDPSPFPPRCCSKIIPLFSCIPFLPQTLFSRFVARREELETPNRTYCSNAQCSKWIRPANISAGVATCTECTQKTCATCKKNQHNGLCPEDKGVKDPMDVALRKKWKTCPNCKEMVELERGCYHITLTQKVAAAAMSSATNAWQSGAPASVQSGTKPTSLIVFLPANNPVQPAANAANARVPAPIARVAPLAAPAQPVRQKAAQMLAQFGAETAAAAAAVATQAQAQAQAHAQFQPQAYQHYHNQAQVHNNHGGNNRGNRRKRRNNQPPHVHKFARYYRTEGWNTECHRCGHEDRWVNCCGGCDLKVCWYCTKHRT